MPLELTQIVLTLSFFAVCGLVGEILVRERKDQPSRDSKR
jgi:hypothetical protein